MVKIKFKSLLLTIIIFVLLTNLAYAARQALEFSDVDVKVGSKTSKNVRNGDTIREEAEPGDSVEFRVEVKNNFTSAENIEIEDISVEVTIEEIDDGDDLEEESKDFDLRPGNDKRVTLKFKVPLEVEEETFDVLIEADGDDENGTSQRAIMRLKLEVEKETHMLKITRATLNPEEVECRRNNVQVGVSVINIGNEDEEDVSIQVVNQELGIDLKEEIDELTAEPNEEESKFSKVFSFDVPSDAEDGSYSISVRALYDENRKKAEETLTLTVNECEAEEVEEEEEEEEQEEEVEVITPKGKTTTTVVQPPSTQTIIPTGAVVTQESFLKSNAFVVGIIIAEVVAVIIGIALVVSLFRRKD